MSLATMDADKPLPPLQGHRFFGMERPRTPLGRSSFFSKEAPQRPKTSEGKSSFFSMGVSIRPRTSGSDAPKTKADEIPPPLPAHSYIGVALGSPSQAEAHLETQCSPIPEEQSNKMQTSRADFPQRPEDKIRRWPTFHGMFSKKPKRPELQRHNSDQNCRANVSSNPVVRHERGLSMRRSFHSLRRKKSIKLDKAPPLPQRSEPLPTHLAVDIPQAGLDRCSVMFSHILQPSPPQPNLLERRKGGGLGPLEIPERTSSRRQHATGLGLINSTYSQSSCSPDSTRDYCCSIYPPPPARHAPAVPVPELFHPRSSMSSSENDPSTPTEELEQLCPQLSPHMIFFRHEEMLPFANDNVEDSPIPTPGRSPYSMFGSDAFESYPCSPTTDGAASAIYLSPPTEHWERCDGKSSSPTAMSMYSAYSGYDGPHSPLVAIAQSVAVKVTPGQPAMVVPSDRRIPGSRGKDDRPPTALRRTPTLVHGDEDRRRSVECTLVGM